MAPPCTSSSADASHTLACMRLHPDGRPLLLHAGQPSRAHEAHTPRKVNVRLVHAIRDKASHLSQDGTWMGHLVARAEEFPDAVGQLHLPCLLQGLDGRRGGGRAQHQEDVLGLPEHT